jgi:tRNA threonylcarbamoyladenosine dehydratase
MTAGYEARFGGIGRLFGRPAQERLRQAHVCVVGMGGVGSWAVEALARSGLGEFTLVDLDEVCISNANRQLHALVGQYGKPKVEVMHERIRAINPDCIVHPLLAFFTTANADTILGARFDYLLDAIDSPSKKCLLLARCRALGIPVVTTGGAGGRRDPTAIRVADLAGSSHDRLLQEVRRGLRRDFSFPRGAVPFGISCVFSTEAPVFPAGDGSVCAERPGGADLRLDCDRGYGTASFVTGAFGFAAAAVAVRHLSGV